MWEKTFSFTALSSSLFLITRRKLRIYPRMRSFMACHFPDRQSRVQNRIWPDLAFGFTNKRSEYEIDHLHYIIMLSCRPVCFCPKRRIARRGPRVGVGSLSLSYFVILSCVFKCFVIAVTAVYSGHFTVTLFFSL